MKYHNNKNLRPMRHKDYYKILGINNTATSEEIESAYRHLSKRYHSEEYDDEISQQILQNIVEAFMVLGDPKLRMEYDEKGNDFEIPDSFYTSSEEYENELVEDEQENTKNNQNESAIEEIAKTFKSFFEKGFEDVIRMSRQQQKRNLLDIRITLPFSLEDVTEGAVKKINVQGSEIEVPIPKGAFTGQVLRFVKQGKKSEDEQLVGDLWITLVEQPHSYFFRKGNDILYHASVDIFTALLGGKITVPALGGKKLKMDIPQGLLSNTPLKVEGEGLPVFNQPDASGDFYVELHVEMPRNLTEEEVTLIKQLRNLRKG